MMNERANLTLCNVSENVMHVNDLSFSCRKDSAD
jgi:hypothetical protein